MKSSVLLSLLLIGIAIAVPAEAQKTRTAEEISFEGEQVSLYYRVKSLFSWAPGVASICCKALSRA